MGDQSHQDSAATAALGILGMFDEVPDPDPDWVAANPDKALLFFFVSPRPCDGLDRLMGWPALPSNGPS